LACWGVGKEFGDGETPSKVYISISGIEKGPGWSTGDGEPLDGDYTLYQNLSYPCHFRFWETPISITWSNLTSVSEVFVNNGEGVSCFHGHSDQCDIMIYNDLSNRFINGTCFVTIPEIEE
jgi:hypothetical protein